MGTILDAKLPPVVAKTLAKYGKPLTFVVASKTPSASAGKPTLGSEPDVMVIGSPPYPYERRFVDGDVIRAGDLQTIIGTQDAGGAVTTFRPGLGMRCKFESSVAGTDPTTSGPIDALVVAVSPIYSGEKVCAWDVALRI